LAIPAAGLLAYALLDLRVESVEIAGVKATVGTLEKRVDQIEAFVERKKIEVFDRNNWHDRVSVAANKPGAIVLQVTLEQEPNPGSVEVFEGLLLMPEQKYQSDGRVLKFPVNGGDARRRNNGQVLSASCDTSQAGHP
jgi:hypothetical protein